MTSRNTVHVIPFAPEGNEFRNPATPFYELSSMQWTAASKSTILAAQREMARAARVRSK